MGQDKVTVSFNFFPDITLDMSVIQIAQNTTEDCAVAQSSGYQHPDYNNADDFGGGSPPFKTLTIARLYSQLHFEDFCKM